MTASGPTRGWTKFETEVKSVNFKGKKGVRRVPAESIEELQAKREESVQAVCHEKPHEHEWSPIPLNFVLKLKGGGGARKNQSKRSVVREGVRAREVSAEAQQEAAGEHSEARIFPPSQRKEFRTLSNIAFLAG